MNFLGENQAEKCVESMLVMDSLPARGKLMALYFFLDSQPSRNQTTLCHGFRNSKSESLQHVVHHLETPLSRNSTLE